MYLVYSDEIKKSKDQPYEVIGGIAIHDSKLPIIINELNTLVKDSFSNETNHMNIELHAKEIYQNQKKFKDIDIKIKDKLLSESINILIKNEVPTVIVMDKTGRYGQKTTEILETAFFEKVDNLLCSKEDYGILFFDKDSNKRTSRLMSMLTVQQQNGSNYGHKNHVCRNILDTAYFSPSNMSRLIQLSDIFLYGYFKYYLRKDIKNKLFPEFYKSMKKLPLPERIRDLSSKI